MQPKTERVHPRPRSCECRKKDIGMKQHMLFAAIVMVGGFLFAACGDDSDDNEESLENEKAACSDEKDNDGDGDIDCEDADCEAYCNDTGSEPEVVYPDERHLLLRDEGNSALHYVDMAEPDNNWHADVPQGRDMQLVGGGRVMIGTQKGYQEYDIETGELVDEVDTFSKTLAATRLRNGNTLLVGTDWQDEDGIVLVEVDDDAEVVRTISNPDYSYARLVRQTADGTFLVAADKHILELDEDGAVVWEATVEHSAKPHAWIALRLASGETVVSSGYAANLQIFDADGDLVTKIKAEGAEAHSYFYSGLQVLENGNFVVANWQNHGTGNGDSGIQVLELNADSEIVWSWKQDAEYVSSLQAALVLDGLDLDKLHVEDETGALAPVE